MTRFVIQILSIVCFTATSLHAEFRTWSNTEGTKLDAEFVKVEGENVTFRLRTGKLVSRKILFGG